MPKPQDCHCLSRRISRLLHGQCSNCSLILKTRVITLAKSHGSYFLPIFLFWFVIKRWPLSHKRACHKPLEHALCVAEKTFHNFYLSSQWKEKGENTLYTTCNFLMNTLNPVYPCKLCNWAKTKHNEQRQQSTGLSFSCEKYSVISLSDDTYLVFVIICQLTCYLGCQLPHLRCRPQSSETLKHVNRPIDFYGTTHMGKCLSRSAP